MNQKFECIIIKWKNLNVRYLENYHRDFLVTVKMNQKHDELNQRNHFYEVLNSL